MPISIDVYSHVYIDIHPIPPPHQGQIHDTTQRRRSHGAHAPTEWGQAHFRAVRRHQPAVLRRAATAGPRHGAHPDARRTQRRLHGRRLRAGHGQGGRVRGPQRRRRHLPVAGPGRGQRVVGGRAGDYFRRLGGLARQVPADRAGPGGALSSPDQVEHHHRPCRPDSRRGARGLPRHDDRPPRHGAPVPAVRRAEARGRPRRRVGPARARPLPGDALRPRPRGHRAGRRPPGGRARRSSCAAAAWSSRAPARPWRNWPRP